MLVTLIRAPFFPLSVSKMFSGDVSSTDPMFSGVSLQSLLSMNPSLFGDGYPTLASLTDTPNPNPKPQQQQQSPNLLLLLPKTEQQFNFLHRLPELQSADEIPEAKRQRSSGAAVVIPQSNLARQRRQKLSEKTRCLQKLMPWDKKMDQATLLEEAHKYVKFLQAQFRVLQSMPCNTSSLPPLENGGVFGDLEKLNRNQLLQVLVNSPVAQTMLYSQGFCVFSLEQLSLLRKLSQRRQQLQQEEQVHVADPASSKTFFNSFIQ